MAVNSLAFSYQTDRYLFNANSLNENLYTIQFLSPVDKYSLPQKFFLNIHFTMVFLTEEPNAVYALTNKAYEFLRCLSEDLRRYVMEFAC